MASKPDKTMSSRLMTMKFMQRAAATATPPASTTPTQPPHKRQRLSNGTAAAVSPATPSDQELIQAALAEEEVKRSQAIERQAAEAGETRWVLDIAEAPKVRPGVNVVTAGYGEIDDLRRGHDDEGPEPAKPASTGRMTFGKYQDPDAVVPKEEEDTGTSTSESDSEDDEEDEISVMMREERKAASARRREVRRQKKKKAQAEVDQLAQERRKKNVKLNRLTSISGGGNAESAGDMVCYGCGEKGHPKRECPANKGSTGGLSGKSRNPHGKSRPGKTSR